MLEPSDNGITFEGLIDALMVSLYLALHASSVEPEQILIELAHGINSNTGFVRRVQSSEVEEQESTDFCLHFNFPGGKPAICSNFTARLKHWLQLKDLCLNLQNVVHTFAKLRVNIGDFKVTSKLFCTGFLVQIETFLLLGDPSDWSR